MHNVKASRQLIYNLIKYMKFKESNNVFEEINSFRYQGYFREETKE